MKEKTLFAVMVTNRQIPAIVYPTYDEAEQEAIRLCKKERLDAYVLKVVSHISLNDVTIEHY
jgi:hypothetical protein